MTSPLPVSARRLRRRAVQMTDHQIPGAALFPFFDREGEAQWVVLLPAGTGQINVLRWHADLMVVPAWGPVRVEARLAESRELTDRALDHLARLWHYDPRCVLDGPEYAGHPAVPLLKATNCIKHLTRKVTMVYFARDLSGPRWVSIEERRQGTIKRWQSEFLPEARPGVREAPPPPTPRPKRAPAWQLDPIWARR